MAALTKEERALLVGTMAKSRTIQEYLMENYMECSAGEMLVILTDILASCIVANEIDQKTWQNLMTTGIKQYKKRVAEGAGTVRAKMKARLKDKTQTDDSTKNMN